MNTNTDRIQCKICGSYNTKKDGKHKGIQKWACKDCGKNYLDNNASPGMRTTREHIEQALRLYYQGTSVNKIRIHLQQKYNNSYSVSTIYKWIVKYSNSVPKNVSDFHPKVSDSWVIDETPLIISGKQLWVWDVIDTKTHFLLASSVLIWRNALEFTVLFEKATRKALKIPKMVIADNLINYLQEMNADIKVEKGGRELEEFHRVFQWRNYLMKDLKRIDKAIEFDNGWVTYYNHFRKSESLGNKSPIDLAILRPSVQNI